MYESILLVIFLLIAVAIIGLVLIQNGKGADMGASFGAGASTTLFGSSGSGNFLTRVTSILGVLFFVVSLALANLSSNVKSEFSDLSQGTKADKAIQLDSSDFIIKKPEANPTVEIPE